LAQAKETAERLKQENKENPTERGKIFFFEKNPYLCLCKRIKREGFIHRGMGFSCFLVFIKNKNIRRNTMATIYMTKEGQQKKLDELNHLENVERPRIIQQIAEARDKGDLSENAEYDAAKEEQGMIESKIAELKSMLANVRIIDESKIKSDSVQLLTTVTIRNTKNQQQMTYTIVSENEANLKEHKLSITTPVAKGLLGKKKGEKAVIKLPVGEQEFEVVDITV
jgi:transcription elongation factor GreA